MNDNFDAMDRLLEMGMTASIATQMMNSMNTALNNMQTPGQQMPGMSCTPADNNATPTVQGTPDVEVQATYAVIDGHIAGPLTDRQLAKLVQTGALTQQTLVWRPGLPEWKYAADVPEVYKLLLLSL